MSFEKPNIDEPKVLKADNYEFKIGDSVSVVRSDGHVEDDWTLFSFGNRCAVVHKGSGDRTLQKVIDLKEFKRIQIRAKGAPEEIFKLCTHYHLDRDEQMSVARLQQAKAYYEELSRQGFRVLALATKHLSDHQDKHVENNLTLRGFVAFYDPPKKNIKPTLELIKRHGVEIKILTGDSPLVTAKICEELGIAIKGVLTGEDLDINNLSDEALAIKVSSATICARLSPNQKERIIRTRSWPRS
jgi:Mg2+-importing ATPase